MVQINKIKLVTGKIEVLHRAEVLHKVAEKFCPVSIYGVKNKKFLPMKLYEKSSDSTVRPSRMARHILPKGLLFKPHFEIDSFFTYRLARIWHTDSTAWSERLMFTSSMLSIIFPNTLAYSRSSSRLCSWSLTLVRFNDLIMW